MPRNESFLFTSESITEGHPDKVCDALSDAVLDAHLSQDPFSRVACEALAKGNQVVLAGEISSYAQVELEPLVRRTVEQIGYDDSAEPFCASTLQLSDFISAQATEIDRGVNPKTSQSGEQGAGDQGLMFGYATDETANLMPLPILLAHRITAGLAEDRRDGVRDWLRPDGKTQVTVGYQDGRPEQVTEVVVSTQHRFDASQDQVREYVASELLPRTLGAWHNRDIRLHVNPTGSFVEGGPAVDAGLTGRKIIADTYGGFARHGGGAFSGKDPSKVDRSAAYFCRYVARKLVAEGGARRVEIQVAYAIGEAQPVSIHVDTFRTGDAGAAVEFVRGFDFRPAAIIERLELLRPIYGSTTNYGHFGRPGLPWEE